MMSGPPRRGRNRPADSHGRRHHADATNPQDYVRHQAPVCAGGSHGCLKVQQSRYARPGGIPMPLFGMAGPAAVCDCVHAGSAGAKRQHGAYGLCDRDKWVLDLPGGRDRPRGLLLVRQLSYLRGSARDRELRAVRPRRAQLRPARVRSGRLMDSKFSRSCRRGRPAVATLRGPRRAVENRMLPTDQRRSRQRPAWPSSQPHGHR
jgi:hypothetical protein